MTTDITNSTAAAAATDFAAALAAFDDALASHEADELTMSADAFEASDVAVDTAAWRVIETPAGSLKELVLKFDVVRRNGLVGDEAGPGDLANYQRIADAARRDLDVLFPS